MPSEQFEPQIRLMKQAFSDDKSLVIPFCHELVLGGKVSVLTWPDVPGGGRSLPS